MSFAQTVLLAAFAGGTIYLGLPVGRLRNLSASWQAMLRAAAGGVILFLICDVLSQAIEPVSGALYAASRGTSPGEFAVDAAVLAASVAIGLLSVTYVTTRLRARAHGPSLTRQLALDTAIGLGLHNFSEDLAIGQSSATGATSLAFILVIGYALHNTTRAAGSRHRSPPDETPSWCSLGFLGLVGGGPTFLGSVVGYTFVSPVISIAFLGLAAGALVFVFNEMTVVVRCFSFPMTASTALLIGLLAGFGTDFLLTVAGV